MYSRVLLRTAYSIFSLFLIVVLAGCSSAGKHFGGQIDLIESGDEGTITRLEAAVKEKPNDRELQVRLFRTKLNYYLGELVKARRLMELDKKEEALAAYDKAYAVFPDNIRLSEEIRKAKGEKASVEKTQKSSIVPPIELRIEGSQKASINLKSVPVKQIFQALGKSFGVNFIFDKDFRDFVYSLQVNDMGFMELLDQLCLVSSAQYRVQSANSILIYPNTPYKTRSLSLRGVKTFYLSNILAADAKKLISGLFRDQQVLLIEDLAQNALMVKCEAQGLREIERFIHQIDRPRSEVLVKVEIMELTRGLTNSIGLDMLDSDGKTAYKAGITSGQRYESDGDVGIVNKPLKFDEFKDLDIFMVIPSAALELFHSDSNSRIIARPNLRSISGEEVNFKVGDEVPVTKTEFSSLTGTSASAYIPSTQYEYKDVGLTVKMTPFVHHDGDVTLKIELKTSFLASSANAYTPTIGTRELKNTIRLKEGETNIIGGFIRDEERGSLQGLPVLSQIPILGQLFGKKGKEISQTDLVMAITPYIVRKANPSPEELIPIWINAESSDSASAGQGLEGVGPEEGMEVGPGNSTPVGQPPVEQNGETPEAVSGGITLDVVESAGVDEVVTVTVNLAASAALKSLSLGGVASGPAAEVVSVKTDLFDPGRIKAIQSHRGAGFDVALSSVGDEGIPSGQVAVVEMRFKQAGEYTLSVHRINGFGMSRQRINLGSVAKRVVVR